MKIRAKKIIPPPAIGDSEIAEILAKARRTLWALQATEEQIDAESADAVTIGRHDQRGQRFAENIAQAVKTQGEAAINRVITKALLKPKPLF